MAELPRLPPAESSHRVGCLVCHEACLVQLAELPRRVLAALSRPVARLACHEPCLVQTAKAKCLLDLLSHPAVRARVCLAAQAKLAPSPLARRVGSRQQLARCLVVVQPHALAEEYSSGSRF